MIRSVIVDDDNKNIRVLKGLIGEFCQEVQVVGEATGIEEAVKLVRASKPQLLFLDIEMPYGNGFQLLDRLMPLDFEIIFITAYDNYAIKAIRYCALDYLLKPVNITELLNAVQRVSEQLQSRETNQKLQLFVDSLKSRQNEMQKIAIPGMDGLNFVDMKDIIRCESEKNYTHVYLVSGKKITTTKTIGEFEIILPEGIFFRIHNSHLINLNCIKKYFKGRGGYVVMEDDTNIEVAARRKDDFLNRFG
jgi:two-component system LytT family response regulator